MAKKKKTHVTVPKKIDPGGGKPTEHLAYLNWQEMEQLRKLNGEGPYKGPKGIPSFVLGGFGSSGASTYTKTGTTNTTAERNAAQKSSTSPTSASKETAKTAAAANAAAKMAADRIKAAKETADRIAKDSKRVSEGARDAQAAAVQTRATGPISGAVSRVSGLGALPAGADRVQIGTVNPNSARLQAITRGPGQFEGLQPGASPEAWARAATSFAVNQAEEMGLTGKDLVDHVNTITSLKDVGLNPAGVEAISRKLGYTPIGLRSNNPGNLLTSGWQKDMPGYTGPMKSPNGLTYSSYNDPRWGMVAQQQLLGKYYDKGLDTINGVVDRYAPVDQNNSAAANRAYKDFLSKQTGFAKDQPLTRAQVQSLGPLKTAFENSGKAFAGGPFGGTGTMTAAAGQKKTTPITKEIPAPVTRTPSAVGIASLTEDMVSKPKKSTDRAPGMTGPTEAPSFSLIKTPDRIAAQIAAVSRKAPAAKPAKMTDKVTPSIDAREPEGYTSPVSPAAREPTGYSSPVTRVAAGTPTSPYEPKARPAGTLTGPYEVARRVAAGTPTSPYEPKARPAGTLTSPYEKAPVKPSIAAREPSPYDPKTRVAAGTLTSPYEMKRVSPDARVTPDDMSWAKVADLQKGAITVADVPDIPVAYNKRGKNVNPMGADARLGVYSAPTGYDPLTSIRPGTYTPGYDPLKSIKTPGGMPAAEALGIMGISPDAISDIVGGNVPNGFGPRANMQWGTQSPYGAEPTGENFSLAMKIGEQINPEGFTVPNIVRGGAAIEQTVTPGFGPRPEKVIPGLDRDIQRNTLGINVMKALAPSGIGTLAEIISRVKTGKGLTAAMKDDLLRYQSATPEERASMELQRPELADYGRRSTAGTGLARDVAEARLNEWNDRNRPARDQNSNNSEKDRPDKEGEDDSPGSGGESPVDASNGKYRPYIYYLWDLGSNIPSPGDTNYNEYQKYLSERSP